ncbi:hypothetical protein PCANB_000772 [Pneumocystis canis]|nr:hypothetical protein PCANB_000772 [Pneumocystis canis]
MKGYRVRKVSLKYANTENSSIYYGKKTGFPYEKKRSLNIHKQWSHDLFNEKAESTVLSEEKKKKLASNPLFQRIMNTKDVKIEKKLENNPLYARLQGLQSSKAIKTSVQEKTTWSIKGASGATTVVIKNLAEGTSAEDVKISLASLGHIQACSIYKTGHGSIQAEVTFSFRSEANTAVEKLNNAIADGHILTLNMPDD